jgi:MFS family permease
MPESSSTMPSSVAGGAISLAAARWPVAGLAVVLTATFLGQFDFFVVNVAGPAVRADLRAGDSALELIVGGYAFAYAAGLITAGRLGDVLGCRRMFVIGISAFGVASLLCGISPNAEVLVVCRLLQGAAASIMLPQVLAYITATIAPRRRAGAIAWYGVTAGLGSICGQVLGGVLVEHGGGLGWRLIFLVNLPVALVASVLAWFILPAPGQRGTARFDHFGAAGVTLTLVALLAPLTLGPGQGWPTWTIWCLAVVPLLALLTAYGERKLARRGGAPIVPTALLHISTFAAGTLVTAAFMLFFPSFMFTLTLLLQDGLRLHSLQAGLVFVPAGVAYSISALSARKLFDRIGVAAPLLGCALTALSLVGLVAEIAAGGVSSSVSLVTICAALMSLGNGLVMPALTTVALTDVPRGIAGAASGLIATVQQFASAAGVAVIGTIFFAVARRTAGPLGSVRGAVSSGLVDLVLIALVAASLLAVSRVRRARLG